jgi:hypothetical protein
VAAWKVYVLGKFLCTQEFWVYKVLAVNELDNCAAPVDVTRHFSSPGRTFKEWEEVVGIATGWDHGSTRLDVRYLAHGHKYRLVLHPGDVCSGALGEALGSAGKCIGGPTGVVRARLFPDVCRSDPTAPVVDITRRVIKYQGHAKDWNRGIGLRVRVRDLFPKDNFDDLLQRYDILELTDVFGNTTVFVLQEARDLGAR